MGAKSQRGWRITTPSGDQEMTIINESGFYSQRGGSLSFGEIPDLMGLPGVHIEVKRRELADWMKQAEREPFLGSWNCWVKSIPEACGW